MGLYERIRDIAKEKGYSVNKLEKELGFARSSISKFNANSPSTDKVRSIAKFLGVTVDCLVNDNTELENGYYTNPRTAEVAQKIYENKELGLLFDAAADAEPEDLEAVHNMLLALKRKERGNID